MTLQEILHEVKKLTDAERDELVEAIQEMQVSAHPKQRNVMEVFGVGAGIWRDIDVEQYINEMRDEWDAPRE